MKVTIFHNVSKSEQEYTTERQEVEVGQIEVTRDSVTSDSLRWATIHEKGLLSKTWINLDRETMDALVEAWAHPERDS